MAALPLSAALTTLLTDEIRSIEGFIDLLKQEEAALVATDLDTLLELINRKTEIATHLNTLVERREAAQKTAGMPPGGDGMARWAALADPSGKVAGLWARLLTLAGQARDQNQINGKLIALHFQHNQRALATLMAAADMATTYGRDGQQKGGGTGRLLGSA